MKQATKRQKIRWKPILALALLFIGWTLLALVLTNPYFYVSIQHDFYNNLSAISIFYLIFIAIFAFSIRSTERRILEKGYSNIWLLKFNITFWAGLSVFFELANIVASLIWPCAGEDCLGPVIFFVIAPFYAFICVAIFSLIPSFIFAHIYKNDKLRKVLLYITIVLACIFLLLAVWGFSNCDIYKPLGPPDNNNNYRICLTYDALAKHDPISCKTCLTESCRSICYESIGTYSKDPSGDEETCKKIEDPASVSSCLASLERSKIWLSRFNKSS